jgi:hypothetical protein
VEGRPVDVASLEPLAEHCVTLVAESFERSLDWQLPSLRTLDEVCAELTAQGPLAGERFVLWVKLAGAYVGVVVVRAYDGRWIHDEKATGGHAVKFDRVVAFPFGFVAKVLRCQPWKSIASFGRTIPILEKSRPGR